MAIIVTVIAWAAYVLPTLTSEISDPDGWSLGTLLETMLYIGVISLLAFSAVNYLLARHGSLVRTQRHRRAPRGLLNEAADARSHETMTTLVPSYKEQESVIYQTLLSAALQEFPNTRVVLLIDDSPNPRSVEDRNLLNEATALPSKVEQLLASPANRFSTKLEQHEARPGGGLGAVEECADEYLYAVEFLQYTRQTFVVRDQAERFCRDEVLGGLQRNFEAVETALRSAAESGEELSESELLHLYQRLAWTFNAEVATFQRKSFANLSHEPNKAMNLNSYIGLMGGAYRIVGHGDQLALAECDESEADLIVPESDYVLTLDADSVLLPEYCLRLTHRLNQPGFEDVAVIQTPYSSYPGGATRVERISAATTDIQHVLHQGMTYFDATFWVGANAILRREALADIETIDNSGVWPVKRYISDHTVIEDTESSIDLVASGWRLHNYNERLSYSATPPDFGSLCIQRQRWANGGLLILPKLRHCLKKGVDPVGMMLRLNYMASIAWASVGLMVMLLWPFGDRLLSPLVIAMAVPYFAAMSSDLKRCGFKRIDVVRIYAFNLLMLPVNLVGSAKSIYQAVSGGKFAFVRTPKVKSRTTAAFPYVVFPYLLIAWSVWTVYRDIGDEQYAHAVFAGLNAALALYGLVAFIGIGNSLVDMSVRVFDLLRTDRQATSSGEVVPVEAWEDALFYGDDGSRKQVREGRLPSELARFQPEEFAPPEEQATVNEYGSLRVRQRASALRRQESTPDPREEES